MIRMCVWFGLVIMLKFAVVSSMEYKVVDVIEGGNATLNFTASGLTIFYVHNCEKWIKITKIGQYCGSADNCSTSSSTPGVSIQTGRLIVHNVINNRCYSAKTIRGHKKIFYNVTVKKLHSTISPETSTSTFTTETPDYNSTSNNSYNNTESLSVLGNAVGGSVAALILVAIVLLAVWYIHKQRTYQGCKRHPSVMLANVSNEEIIMGQPEAANSLLTTVNETQL